MNEIKDLVATAISEPLFNKIQKGVATSRSATYHISATGNDSNDGSQAKPFKTLTKCLEHIKINNGNNQNINKVSISFLTDFTYTETIFINNPNNNLAISFNANGKNVILGGIAFNQANVSFSDISFKPTKTSANNSLFDITDKSKISFNNCKFFSPSAEYFYYFCTRYFSYCNFNGSATFNFTGSSKAQSIFCCYASAVMFIDAKIDVRSNITVGKVFEVTRASEIIFNPTASFVSNGFTVDAEKYVVSKLSMLNLVGRGTTELLGNKEGVVLHDGKVY